MSIAGNIVARLHVSTSNMGVIRAIRTRFSPQALTRKHRKARKAIYRDALRHHHSNQTLYRYVVNGGK